jgi:hypothetical protein
MNAVTKSWYVIHHTAPCAACIGAGTAAAHFMAHCVGQSTTACTWSAAHSTGCLAGRTEARAARGAGASPATRMLSRALGCSLVALIIVLDIVSCQQWVL